MSKDPQTLSSSSWKLDHIGHAVFDLTARIKTLESTFGFQLLERERLAEFQVELAFLQAGDSLLELLSPLDGNKSLTNFLNKRGESLHHIAYQVADLSTELGRLKDSGVRLIDETPRTGARGHLVAFIHPSAAGGLLVELCQATK